MHHADAKIQCVKRAFDMHFLAIEQDTAAFRLLMAEEYLHKSRFSGAVLAHEAVDLSFPELKVHVLVGHEAVGIYFGNVLHGENDFRVLHSVIVHCYSP